MDWHLFHGHPHGAPAGKLCPYQTMPKVPISTVGLLQYACSSDRDKQTFGLVHSATASIAGPRAEQGMQHGACMCQSFSKALWAQGETSEPSLVALFTFVARDPLTGKAMAINSLQPDTDTDRALFAERQRIADQRRAVRKAASAPLPASTSLPCTPVANMLWKLGR